MMRWRASAALLTMLWGSAASSQPSAAGEARPVSSSTPFVWEPAEVELEEGAAPQAAAAPAAPTPVEQAPVSMPAAPSASAAQAVETVRPAAASASPAPLVPQSSDDAVLARGSSGTELALLVGYGVTAEGSSENVFGTGVQIRIGFEIADGWLLEFVGHLSSGYTETRGSFEVGMLQNFFGGALAYVHPLGGTLGVRGMGGLGYAVAAGDVVGMDINNVLRTENASESGVGVLLAGGVQYGLGELLYVGADLSIPIAFESNTVIGLVPMVSVGIH